VASHTFKQVKSAKSLNHTQSAKSLNPLRSKNELLSLDLVIPEMPQPVVVYKSPSREQRPVSSESKSIHTRRFKYGINEKVDLK
jgi:hypothetical protein